MTHARSRTLRSGVLAALLLLPVGVVAQAPGEAFDIPSKVAELSLHLEHRAPSGKPAEQAVLLVHGNFFPASTAFGVDLPGGSVLERLAEAGLSVYTLDLRGYGGSTRPPFMSEPIGPYVAFATTADAQQDIASALAFIREREHVKRVSLVGWSWGAALVGEFASKHAAQVDKLVLYGPGWLHEDPAPQPPSGSYRTLDRTASRARVLNGVPPERVEEINPSPWFERWWALNLRYDAWGSRQSPPVVRAPSGVTQAVTDFWARGKPPWDPRKVRAKTLVIVGEWDRNTPVEGARAVHGLLTHAASRELTVLPEATHFAILEKNRGVLLDALARFLGPKTELASR
jgi:pimeloyl-ACP methyl ester carboxylesterase